MDGLYFIFEDRLKILWVIAGESEKSIKSITKKILKVGKSFQKYSNTGR